MIFAAGLGTRLQPLTDNMPKALVPVAGIPMLERVIGRLTAAGFTELVVNVHHFGRQIIDFVQQHNQFGVTLHISDERGLLLDTGGGILQARRWLDGDEPFLVHNADIITDLDLPAFYRHHLSSGATATLLTNHRSTTRYLLADDACRLRGWTNLATSELLPHSLTADTAAGYHRLAFGGVHVLSPAIFRHMNRPPWQGRFPIIPFYLSICDEVRIDTYTADDIHWYDVGKPATLAQAADYLSHN
jgi:NDP-sugar pyrophosphorylase family protein